MQRDIPRHETGTGYFGQAACASLYLGVQQYPGTCLSSSCLKGKLLQSHIAMQAPEESFADALLGHSSKQVLSASKPPSRDSLQMLPISFWQADRIRVATPKSISSLVMLFTAACREVCGIRLQSVKHSFAGGRLTPQDGRCQQLRETGHCLDAKTAYSAPPSHAFLAF